MPIQPNKMAMEWALNRSGISRETILKKWPKFDQWLDGSWSPTVKQIRDFADTVHVNVSALFSDNLPELGLQIADFRTTDDNLMVEPSPELYDTIGLMMRRQAWMHEYFYHENYPRVSYVGSFSAAPMTFDTAEELACKLHEILCLEDNWAASCKTVGEALKFVKDRIESLGISVVVNGVVNDNTHRPLLVEEFRGFVLSDELAPLVFINGKDTKSAQLFTLIHELAHLAYSQTGVSNPSDEFEASGDIESFCNRVAADFLIPTSLIVKSWEESTAEPFGKIKNIAKKTKVNFVVVARKARDIELIDNETFFELYNAYKSSVPESAKAGSGGDYFLNKQYRLGSVFSDAIWTAVNTGFVSYRDAYDLTGMGSSSFRKYFTGVA